MLKRDCYDTKFWQLKYSQCILHFLNSSLFAQKRQKMIKKPFYFNILAAFLLSACASQPADESVELLPAQSEPVLAENSESEEDPNELICRREQVTGSNF